MKQYEYILPYQYVIVVDKGRIVQAYDRNEMSCSDHDLKLKQHNWKVVEEALESMYAVNFHDFIELVGSLNTETNEYKICEAIISKIIRKLEKRANELKCFLIHDI